MSHKKENISLFTQNFDDDFKNKVDWYNTHLNLMFLEVKDIQRDLFIFNTIQEIIEVRVNGKKRIKYSEIRASMIGALPYKIILSLSKILIGKKEYSLYKTINSISQMEEFKYNEQIKDSIMEIRKFLSDSKLVYNISIIRDQFFAHLDKESVLTDFRILPAFSLRYINDGEINQLKLLIANLYESCYKTKLDIHNEKISKEKIIKCFFEET